MEDFFPIYKGIQKPLEFMGIRGRFLTFAAIAIGVSFLGFILFSIILGKLAGFIAMIVLALVGLATIYIRQRNGLHAKRHDKGICIYHGIFWKSHTNLTHPGKYFRPSKVKIMRPTSPK